MAFVVQTSTATAATTPGPVAVTPYSGFNALLTRAPYVTDLTQTSADVTWATTSAAAGSLQWGPLGNCTAHQAPVPVKLPDSFPALGTPNSVTSPQFKVISTLNEYQSTVVLTGLSPSTTYCYLPLSPPPNPVDLLGINPSPTFTTLNPVGPSAPLTFAVVGDLGETLYSSTTPFANSLNTDQAAIDSLIGSSGAKFVVTAGDVAYAGGTDANYGDLQQTGSEISDIFGPSYWPQMHGLPVFAGEGNHGQNVFGLRTWPQSNTASNSGGTYAYNAYPAGSNDGTTAGSYPDAWYAVAEGNVRIYVLNAAWADGSNIGTATGSACSPTGATVTGCQGYQIDYDKHWTPTSPEYQWLAADMANHPGTVKMAVWHYPLRSDNSTQPSDVYLQNSAANPAQSTSLEKLLAAGGVQVVFNGHAHTYQRITPNNYQQNGQVVTYVTGGGGAVLEPVSGQTTAACKSFLASSDIYAIGWSPTNNAGSSCGTTVPFGPSLSAAQVYNFLKVTVNGGTVTVTPVNAAGQSFDQKTYNYSTAAATVIDTPPALTNSTTAAISFHSTGGGSAFSCSLDSGGAAPCTSPVNYSGLSAGPHSLTVTGTGATPATANWTIDTSPPSTPTNLAGAPASGTQVNLTWTASTDNTGVTGYDVYRNGSLLTPTPVTGTSYTDTTASPGTSYQYGVDARDGAGNVSPQTTPVPVTTPTGASGPVLVQTAGSSTTAVTLPGPSTPGDLLVLSASAFTGASKQITAVTDGKNTWTKVGAFMVAGQNSDGEMWYSPNAASVSTVTATTGASTVALRVQEFSGVASVSPLEGSNGAAANGTTASSPQATATSPNDLAVGFIAGHSNTQTISVTSPGYTLQPQQTTTTPSKVSIETGYQVLPSTGPQSFAGSFPSGMYWSAGIALFKAGPTSPPPPNDFSMADNPTSASVVAGAGTTSTISTAVTSGVAQSVALSATGAPAGTVVSFNPQSVTAGQSSTMTVTTATSTPVGPSTITVTGTGASAVHSASFGLTVTAVTGSTPHFVESASGTETAASTSLTGSFPLATVAGDLLVLSASEYSGATNHITSVTDSAGNSWTHIGSGYFVAGHNSNGEMWYSANATSVTSVTVHTATAASISFEVQEFSGIATTNPLDVSAGASNTSTAPSSGAVNSTVANEMAVGFIAGHGNAEPISVTSPGYTNQAQQTTTGTIATVITGYQLLSGAGAQIFAGSFGTAMYWAAGIAVFRPAS
jgi:hypothetical protein